MNYLEAANALLDYLRRPEDELLTQAKREINAACAWANRNYNFKYAEEIAVYTYTANSNFINILDSNSNPKIVSIHSAQILSDTASRDGTTIRVIEYSKLNEWKKKYQDRFVSVDPMTTSNNDFPTVVSDNFPYILSLMGKSVGLYPVPSSDVNLMIHYNSMLPPLVNDSDTNFLLTYCWDFVLSKSMMRMLMLLHDTDANLISTVASQVNVEWDSCKRWDSMLRNSNDNESVM